MCPSADRTQRQAAHRCSFEIARKDLDARAVDMDLAAEPVDLGFHGTAAELVDDAFRIRQSFRQHHRNGHTDNNLDSGKFGKTASLEGT